MKTLSWNVRDLGKLRAVRRLRNKLREVRPNILFLMETKLSDVRMANVQRKCGFSCSFDVSANGSCGGLSLAWMSDTSVSIQSFSSFHIDDVIKENHSTREWRLAGFYGNSVERLRVESWDLLQSLGVDQSLPWLVVGDFNEILLSSEKQGSRIRSDRNMDAFCRALEDCELEDLGFSGNWYTWGKGRLSSNVIHERLDRGVANPQSWDAFPEFSVQHLTHTISDHCPSLIISNPQDMCNLMDSYQAFKFSANWILEEE
ncbi:hypothetical protein HRI_000787700 [Hibiscus trionum]|uniref:Endonuclease/exonuclease/phosphatase domain-containing protein n=1 Tax=Hibiscus trionum TaxID=183268 RepID=A0A9W7H525_HIBTR|nr:hypothetical protein HRI_000787700 [Hibiscus trionum]